MFGYIRNIILTIGSYTLLDKLGKKTISFFTGLGESAILVFQVGRNLRYVFKDRHLIVEQMNLVGVNSLPLVCITAIFAGMTSAVQAGYQLQGVASPNLLLGSATSRAITTELGPVLTGLVLSGRFAASIAAEIGTMKVTEQIDALEMLAINPIRYLALPRILAGLLMMPVLIIFTDIVAICGSMFIGFTTMDVSPQAFLSSVQKFMTMTDLFSGLIKAVFFGASTAIVGCFVGFATEGGAEGVGMATIKAFVLSSAAILVNDYLVASVLLL